MTAKPRLTLAQKLEAFDPAVHGGEVGGGRINALKIQLASDLHLEFLKRDWPGECIIKPVPGADVLVLAGDIAKGTDAFALFQHWPVPVIYIAGNHEFYGHDIEPTREQMKAAAALHPHIHFLENESVVVKGVRFLGTTLWTDYRLNLNRTQRQLMEHAQTHLNDHQLIRCGQRRFSTEDALERHEIARALLTSELARPFDGQTVVVTHHAPHPQSVHSRYAGDDLSAAFASDLSELMLGADLWLHGHVHDSFDYQVGRCRVVANPAGYISNLGWATNSDRFDFENSSFKSYFLLSVE